jgi:hypothetical protein
VVPAGREETSPKVEESIMLYFEKLRREIQKENEKTATEIHEQGRFSGNMWLKRTEWAKHLREFDREWLHDTTKEPDSTRVNGNDVKE